MNTLELSQIQLSQIMTTDLVTVMENNTFDVVDDFFSKNDFHHIPVINEANELVGIVSKSDYLRLCSSLSLFKIETELEKNKRLFQSLLVKEVMSKQVATLRPTDTLALAAGMFKENLFHALPIVEEKKLVGIVTTFDMINFAYLQNNVTTKKYFTS